MNMKSKAVRSNPSKIKALPADPIFDALGDAEQDTLDAVQREDLAARPNMAALVAELEPPTEAEINPATPLTLDEQRSELKKIRGSFLYWATTYAFVENKELHKWVRFKARPCQEKLAGELQKKTWLWILKARRIGITAEIVLFAVWLTTFFRMRRFIAIYHTVPYAQKFIDKCRATIKYLPDWQKIEPETDNKDEMTFNLFMHGSALTACSGDSDAARSGDADFVFIDEGGQIPQLEEILAAIEPALEVGLGAALVLGTSGGPKGYFAKGFKLAKSGNSKFTAVFFSWRELPSRTEEWRQNEIAKHPGNPLFVKREYPETPEEAFEAAQGRVYPLFSENEKFIRSIKIDPDWPKWRMIDWGGVDPFVCLWAVEIPGDPAGLTIAPECPNLIREMLDYSRDDGGAPLDADNHAPDALRYGVVTFGLRGHVHIYREIYEAESAARGLTITELGRRIFLSSLGEQIKSTTADRSRPDSILLFSRLGIKPIRGHRKPSGGNEREIEQGVELLNALVAGTAKNSWIDTIPKRSAGPSAPKNISIDGGGMPRRRRSVFA